MIGVYKITNLINGKMYIGKSENDIEFRLHQHKIGVNSNEHLQRSIHKYGIENFSFEILEECFTTEDCRLRERYWINKLNTMDPYGYNYTSGGENESGFTFCEASKNKMSESAKARCSTDEGKARMAEMARQRSWDEDEKNKVSNTLKDLYSDKTKVPMYGKHHSQETKDKMSEDRSGEKHPMYGKHHTSETKDKISKANKGKIWVNNGIDHQTQIDKEELILYLNKGYSKGMLPKHKKS